MGILIVYYSKYITLRLCVKKRKGKIRFRREKIMKKWESKNKNKKVKRKNKNSDTSLNQFFFSFLNNIDRFV